MFKRCGLVVALCSLVMVDAVYAVPRGLFILLDDSEQSGIEPDAAVTGDLLALLAQQAGPIVVSGSLLANIFSDKQASKNAKYLQALDFNAGRWVIKHINDALFLLVPKVIFIASDAFSLGLKVDQMQTVSLEAIKNRSFLSERYGDYFVDALNKNAIFYTHAEYKAQNRVDDEPIWAFYMMGHGAKDRTIAGLTRDRFKQVLEYFTYKINSRLLMITSCYASGANINTLFTDMKSSVQRTYPFAIITQAITDAPVMNIIPRIENGRITTFEDFAQFYKTITDDAPIDYKKAAELIFPLTPRQEMKVVLIPEMRQGIQRRPVWANVPQIKLPGIEWFSVMASQDEVVTIGAAFAKARDPQKPLNITTFFRSDPQAVLLYATHVPFELMLNGQNLEAIISMIPADAVHSFKKISSNRPLDEILDWFMAVKDLDQRKLFSIDQINNTIKGVIIFNSGKIPGNPWQGTVDRYETYALYYENGQLYVQEAGKKPRIADQSKQKQYAALMQELQRRLKTQYSGAVAREELEQLETTLQKRLQEQKTQKGAIKPGDTLQQTLQNLEQALVALKAQL